MILLMLCDVFGFVFLKSIRGFFVAWSTLLKQPTKFLSVARFTLLKQPTKFLSVARFTV
jgi:hypothetical protein